MTDYQKKLVEDNIKIAYYYVSKRRPDLHLEIEYDDCVQEACLALCSAAERYNCEDNRNARFTTYAWISIENRFKQILRMKCSDVRRANSSLYRTQSVDIFDRDRFIYLERFDNVELNIDIENFLNKEDESIREKYEIVMLNINGMSIEKIGKMLNKSGSEIFRRIKLFKRKAKEYFDDSVGN